MIKIYRLIYILNLLVVANIATKINLKTHILTENITCKSPNS